MLLTGLDWAKSLHITQARLSLSLSKKKERRKDFLFREVALEKKNSNCVVNLNNIASMLEIVPKINSVLKVSTSSSNFLKTELIRS